LKIKRPGVECKDLETSRTRLEITILSPKTAPFQSGAVRHLHLQSTKRPPAKKETKVWNTSILVLSKHRKAVFIFMIITTRRDKDYTSRPSPNRNCLLQPCLSGGETWGWGRGRLVPINTQQLTEPRERGRPKKKTEQRPSKKKTE